MSDSVLRLQYFGLIVCYCAISIGLSLFCIPALYLKCLLNKAYICLNASHGRLKQLLELIRTSAMAPLTILVSLSVDLLVLNIVLTREEKHFEFKYQQSDHFEGVDHL